MLPQQKHKLLSHSYTMVLDKIVYTCHGTFVSLPPVKFAKRFSDRVSTLALRWMVNLFEAVTIFLHLREKKVQLAITYV